MYYSQGYQPESSVENPRPPRRGTSGSYLSLEEYHSKILEIIKSNGANLIQLINIILYFYNQSEENRTFIENALSKKPD